jgi:hypothetical protein
MAVAIIRSLDFLRSQLILQLGFRHSHRSNMILTMTSPLRARLPSSSTTSTITRHKTIEQTVASFTIVGESIIALGVYFSKSTASRNQKKNLSYKFRSFHRVNRYSTVSTQIP